MGEVLKFTPTDGKGCFRRLCCELNCKKHATKFIELDYKTNRSLRYKYFCHEHAPDWADSLNGLE
jgi:hypothetical protein